jgi:hypothetical protein
MQHPNDVKVLTVEDLKKVRGAQEPVDDFSAKAEDAAGNKAEAG